MKQQYLSLFLPAYGVSLIAVPLAFTLDTLGRTTALYPLLLTPAVTWLYTAVLALPLVLVAAGLGLVIHAVKPAWWGERLGRILFVLLCAGLGAVLMRVSMQALEPVAAVAGGTAAWVATSPPAPLRRHVALVMGAGLVVGILQGIQYY